jgi:sulfotransferase family protein
VLERVRVVLCVRDPYDTIASWKRSFAHLRDADVRRTAVSVPENEMLPERDRAELAAVAECPDVAERRARWWAWSARRVLEELDGAVLVDYDRLVRDPRSTLAEVLRGLDPGTPPRSLTASVPRAHRELLDATDRDAIGDLCVPLARELGIALPPERR